MYRLNSMGEYADQVGGVFYWDDYEAIPYNHWKRDCKWLVLILLGENHGAFIPVDALTPREACMRAINEYKNIQEEIEDE